MFEYVHKAGLLPHDLARILLVSRVTASYWLSGRTKPSRMITPALEDLLDRIRQAVEDEQLPLSVDVKRKNRPALIDKALTRSTDIERTS